jgi:hypothetical protein
VHHDADADHGNHRADQVGLVGPVAVDAPSPEQRQHYEEAAVLKRHDPNDYADGVKVFAVKPR